MPRRMCAIVMFYNPVDNYGGRKELLKHGFTVEHLQEWEDPDDGGRSVWVTVEIHSELDTDSFFDWVEAIVEPVGGELCEAGPAAIPCPGAQH